jgi:hypothetical protein
VDAAPAPHRQGVVEQVDALPLQRESLGLAQAQGEGDGPAGGVADPRGGSQDARASSRSRAVAMSLGLCAGGSTRVATLRGT